MQLKLPLLLRNISLSILSDFFLHLGNALILIMISRKLGSSAAGSYNIGITYLFFGTFLAYWGLAIVMTREVAKDRKKFAQYFSNFRATRIVFGVIAALLVVGVALITPNYTTETKLIIIILAISLPANSLANLCQNAFYSFEKFEITSKVSITLMVLKLVLAWFALILLPNPLVWLAVITLAINLLTLLAFLLLMNRLLPTSKAHIDTGFIFSQIKSSFPFFLMAIFMATDNRIDILLISRLLNIESVGYYSAMITVLGVLYLFPEALRNAVLPALARYRQTDLTFLKERFHMIIRFSLLLTIPIAFFVYQFANVVMDWIFGVQFEVSVNLLRICIGSLISYSVMTVYNRLLVVEGKEKQVMSAILISATFTVLLNLILIKPFGLQGVAYVKLTTSVLSMFMYIFLVRRNLFKMTNYASVRWILLSALILLVAFWFTRQFSIAAQSLICLAAYGLAILLLPVFSAQEKQNVFNGIYRLIDHE